MRIFILLFVLIGTQIQAQKKTTPINMPEQAPKKVEMTFENPHQDFGKFKKGEIKETSFKFENTGTEVIEIEIVSGCECTELEWTRKPIKPGESGVIKAKFDSSKKEENTGTVEIDINLKNKDPETGYGIFEIVSYTFEFLP